MEYLPHLRHAEADGVKIHISALDRLFSQYIRTRDHWTCQRCGKVHPPPTMALHCAHTYKRRHQLTRWDADNADALCYGCHQYFEEHWPEHLTWKRQRIGHPRFQRLTRRHQMVGRVDVVATALYYRQQLQSPERR